MTNDLRDAASRKISTGKRLIAGLVFWALLLTVFPVSFFPAERLELPDGMVYCSLSKKLQPTKPPETGKKQKPFDDLCASGKTKEYLFREIVLRTPWRVFTLDAGGMENLIFDYLAHGKSALEKLPTAPHAPSENLTKQLASSVAAGSRVEHKFVWKVSSIIFLPALAARPPTNQENLFSPASLTCRSAELSRRIAPRAPPLFS
jgi:hypothetical protein